MCHPPVCKCDWPQCQCQGCWVSWKLEWDWGPYLRQVGYCWASLSLLSSMVLAVVQVISLQCMVLVKSYGWWMWMQSPAIWTTLHKLMCQNRWLGPLQWASVDTGLMARPNIWFLQFTWFRGVEYQENIQKTYSDISNERTEWFDRCKNTIRPKIALTLTVQCDKPKLNREDPERSKWRI